MNILCRTADFFSVVYLVLHWKSGIFSPCSLFLMFVSDLGITGILFPQFLSTGTREKSSEIRETFVTNERCESRSVGEMVWVLIP